MTLTKAHLIDSVYKQVVYSRPRATEAVESLLEIIKKGLENSEDVLLSGFGKFCVKEKKERKGRNPQTGEDLMLGSRRIVRFRCSGKLRDKMNREG